MGLVNRLAAAATAASAALSAAAIPAGLLAVALADNTANFSTANRVLGRRSVQLLPLALSTSSSVIAPLFAAQPPNNLFSLLLPWPPGLS